jgi:tetratricopeptide (TPR) repeat protein
MRPIATSSAEAQGLRANAKATYVLRPIVVRHGEFAAPGCYNAAMFVRLVFILSLLGVVAGVSTVAWAQPSKKAAATARGHYKKGMKAYDLGRFEEAVMEFEAAYDLDENTAYLFNIAQAYRRGHNDTKALELYKTYLRKAPDATDRANVESIITEIERKIAQAAPPPAPPPAAPAPPVQTTQPSAVPVAAPAARVAGSAPSPADDHPGRALTIAGIATAGVGLAACATGVVFALRAKSKDDEAAKGVVYNPQLKKDADSARTYAYVSFIVGGVAVVTGTVLTILGVTAQGSPTGPAVTSVQPMLGPGTAGLALSGSF